jgi:NADH-quinone oxidoreductase subunit E
MAFAMAWTAFGLGMTAHMLGAMSQAFAAAGQGATRPKPAAKAAEAAKPAPKETAKVLSFETASRAKSSNPVHAAPAKSEDLKVISGIGPKLETLLNKLGIFTLAQIASWSAEDAAKVDQDLQLNGRVLRDDWRGQAKQMAEG